MSWKNIARPHLQRWEGLRLEAYDDGTGVWTIGYGHTGPDVTPGMVITKDEAIKLLDQDMEDHAAVIDSTVKVPINGRMKAAILGLVFNIGGHAWEHDATALRRLNARDYAGAAEAMTWWNRADMDGDGESEEVEGLIRRREAERKMFMRGFAQMQGGKTAGSPGPTEAPAPPPRNVTGGEHKKLAKGESITMNASLMGAITSGGAAVVNGFGDMDWKVAVPLIVVGCLFAYLAFNRWMEAKTGEH